MSCAVQLHLVHWNDDLYDNYDEATRREDGIVIIAVFVTVSYFSKCVDFNFSVLSQTQRNTFSVR